MRPALRHRLTRFLRAAGLLAAATGVVCAEAGAVTFSAESIQLSVAADGKVFELIDRVTNTNRVISPYPHGQQYLCQLKVGGGVHDPTAYSVIGDRLSYTFGSLNPIRVLTVRIEERPRYLLVTLEDLTNPTAVEEARFFALSTRNSLDGTADRFLRYVDSGVGRCMGILPLDVLTRTRTGAAGAGGYLWGLATPGLPYPAPAPLVGRRVALFTCAASTAGIYDIVGQIERDQGIPLGVAARQQAAVRRSGIFWVEFSAAQKDQVLQYTQAVGAGRILLRSFLWADERHAYAPAPMWGGAANLRNWISACQAAGIAMGAHLYPAVIAQDSADYIRAGCDARLRRDRTIMLAADVPATQTTGLIPTTTPPSGWPTDPLRRDIVIGQEILTYTGLQTAGPPYGFTGPFVRAKNQTGPGGLGPQNHAAGATIGHLVVAPEGPSYQWDIPSGGVQQWCAVLAAALDQAGFQFIYTDYVEQAEEPLWFTVGLLHQTICQALPQPPLWMESSETGNFSWSLVALEGQTDYFLSQNTFRSEVDRNVQHALQRSGLNGFTPLQLGWARLCDPGSSPTTPDELEYLLAKSAAHDMPVMFMAWLPTLEQWANREANFYLMAKYEELRLGSLLPPTERSAARQAGRDFMLFSDDAGAYHLVPVTLLNLARSSPDVRGFITAGRLGGSFHATLWPVTASAARTLILDGLAPADIVVKNYRGEAVAVTDLGGGQISIPLSTRLYIKLAHVPDPVRTLGQARVK